MAEPDRRGVFIAWSKDVAANLARHLKPFLEDVLGNATIFMSQAMEGGARWAMEIPRHLESCNAGLVLVTRENRHAPWLHFEAGALSKHVGESRMVPLLCGASIGDIQGTPLSMFQAKNFNRDEFLSICIDFAGAFGVPEETSRRRFERGWPDLERAVLPVPQQRSGPEEELGLSDLMAVIERLAAQVNGISQGIVGQGALATASPAEAARLLAPYFDRLVFKGAAPRFRREPGRRLAPSKDEPPKKREEDEDE